MTTRYFGEPIQRKEDPRLLRGQALFVDDLTLPDMLHVAVLRSSFAHARLRQVDTRQALEQPGVVAAFSASDLGDYWRPGPLLVPPPPISNLEFVARTQVPLARHKLRHVGEPVAVVVAQSRYQAEDALDWIEVEADPLPVVTELEQAIEPGAPPCPRGSGKQCGG